MMKSIVEYINEGRNTPHFVDTFEKELKKLGIDWNPSTYGSRDEVTISKEGVNLCWQNGKTVQRAPRVLYASSRFDDEPAYITIIDRLKENKNLKGFFDELMQEGLTEATGGKTAQWGTWKFAVRSDIDSGIILKALKNNNLI